MLHHDQDLFADLLLRASDVLGIDAAIIEKDYYVSILLAKIADIIPDIIFKGGTSLSKCYHIIDRFSEDIDLSIFEGSKPTQSQRKEFKNNIIKAIEESGLVLNNPEEIKSHRDFNRYIIDYPSVFSSTAINRKLIIETAVFIEVFPTQKKPVGNYLYNYLQDIDALDKIESRNLIPYEIKVQSPERTFIDKVFALCDYHLAKTYDQHSRHIYDLYKLQDIISFDDAFCSLIARVRKERSGHKACLSAQENVKIDHLLNEIISQNSFKEDYQNKTLPLLFKPVAYEEVITVIKTIIEKNLFS